MKIGYHLPAPDSIYAQRTIYYGFKHAFEDMGHQFFTFQQGDDIGRFCEQNKIDIFLTASHFYYRKGIDFNVLKKLRDKGLVVFSKVDYWNSPLSKMRVNEAKSMKDDADAIGLMKDGLLGDIYFTTVEQGDGRMTGFKEVTGYGYETIPLAADKTLAGSKFDPRFEADISFIGTYLPAKRAFMQAQVFPLKKRYDLKLYGQDWTMADRIRGMIQKVGQYYGIGFLRKIQKAKLGINDEATIYRSSLVSINIHEDYQKKYGGDCNERTFKIPLYGGFEVTDDVACIAKYFKPDKEMIIARDAQDWFEKIDHFINNPAERDAIIAAGHDKVMSKHTYHNRAQQVLDLAKSQRSSS